MSYSYNKFLRPITSSDKNIKILDDTNDIKYTIDPFAIQNVSISNNILKINLKSKRIISLHFSTINEAKLALTRIQIQIDTLIKNVPHLIDRDVQNYVDSIFSKVSIIVGPTGATGAADKYSATSSTPFQLPVVGEVIDLETQIGLAYTPAQSVIVYNDIPNLYDDNYEVGGDYFISRIDSYNKTTGQMTLVVDFSTSITTGETFSFWYMNLSGEKGQADRYYTTSSTTLSVPEIGQVVDLEVNPYLAYSNSQNVVVYSDLPNLYDFDYETEGGYFTGQVDYYDFSTGLISIVVENSIGLGTYSTWYMNLSGTPGISASASNSIEKTDRLISNNNLEVVLDSQGTLNTPLLLPTSFIAVCDSNHMIGTYEFIDNNWWQFEVSFQVNPDGIVETMINNIFPILTNPGYVSGNTFAFLEHDHGIPNFIFSIQLNSVVLPGAAGWTANLSVTQPPTYPSTIKSLGAVKITANDKDLTFGTDGTLTFPDNSVQTTAAYTPPYKVYTTLLTQSEVPIFNYKGIGNEVLNIGTTYMIYDGGGNSWDFTNVGTPNNNIGTYFVATGTTTNSWGTNGLLQYNTGAPVVIVLENTIGNIWFTYEGAGLYFIKSPGLFLNDKTWYSILANLNGGSSHIFNLTYIDNSTILVEAVGGDYLLNNTPIEIRVYN